MACRSEPENQDSTAVVVALPLGAAPSGELTAEQEYRDRSDEYAEERKAMNAAQTGRVLREAGVLRIVPRSGDTVALRDSIAPGDDYIRYVYAAHYSKLGVHVVRVQYYEGQSALLIADSTGRRTYVANLPLVAPDSARFAVVSFDLEAGYEPNLLEIWRPAADTVVSEFAHDFGGALGPDSAVWRSGDTLNFVRTRYLTGGDYERVPSRLVGRDGVWRIEPPIP
jgi:hypothetical protein